MQHADLELSTRTRTRKQFINNWKGTITNLWTMLLLYLIYFGFIRINNEQDLFDMINEYDCYMMYGVFLITLVKYITYTRIRIVDITKD